MIVAQISDTHIALDTPDAGQRIRDFERTVADINALDAAPDLIVHTGDVVHSGRAEEYAEAARILAGARAPAYVMAGNKDDRVNLRAAFAGAGYLPEQSGFIDYAIEDHPVRLVMLDTVNPGHRKGHFCAARMARFERLLAEEPAKPVALFAHHPPFEILVGPERFHFDDLDAMARFASAVDRSGRVIALFCGHVHRSTFGQVGAVPAMVMTATATTRRYGDYPAAMAARPTYLLHRYRDGAFTTETRMVGIPT